MGVLLFVPLIPVSISMKLEYGTVIYFKGSKLTYRRLQLFIFLGRSISIYHHPEFHAGTKHIDISYDFLRDLVKSGTVYINT